MNISPIGSQPAPAPASSAPSSGSDSSAEIRQLEKQKAVLQRELKQLHQAKRRGGGDPAKEEQLRKQIEELEKRIQELKQKESQKAQRQEEQPEQTEGRYDTYISEFSDEQSQ